jgi:hypothetical protein
MVFLMHSHFDLKKSHFDPRNQVPDEPPRGDELFVATHLAMKGDDEFMMKLKRYHHFQDVCSLYHKRRGATYYNDVLEPEGIQKLYAASVCKDE